LAADEASESMTKERLASHKKMKERHRAVEREVLQALRLRKQPVKWDMLCAHFERHAAVYSISAVLKELKDGCFIAVDKGQNVTITAIGLKRLTAGMF
jgi:hypothetical protein